MTHTYNISGMTCGNCVGKVKSELLKLGDITGAEIQLSAPQATISMQKHINTEHLQAAIAKAGNFKITEADSGMANVVTEKRSWFTIYKPVLLVFFYVTAIAIISAVTAYEFDANLFMRVFMSGFFLAFSFFKLLDLSGFADSYSTYDIIAKKWRGWAYVYAFIELALGIAFALNFYPLLTNTVTFAVMSISIIGVLQAIFNKRRIQCACLGAVFNLPMSTVTVIEDALMIFMSGMMIAALL